MVVSQNVGAAVEQAQKWNPASGSYLQQLYLTKQFSADFYPMYEMKSN